MKSAVLNFLRLLLIAVAGVLLTGCLFSRGTDSISYFVLSPISTNERAMNESPHVAIGIGYVKMPAYLLRTSMAVRSRTNQIEFIQDARWAERLDQNFQQTVAANLSRLLPPSRVYVLDSGRDEATFNVFITVQQFDVDTRGSGILAAQWRIATSNNEKPLKCGQTSLARSGNSPRGNPEAIAMTLSKLTEEFSRELAKEIRENANP